MAAPLSTLRRSKCGARYWQLVNEQSLRYFVEIERAGLANSANLSFGPLNQSVIVHEAPVLAGNLAESIATIVKRLP